jgi:hypothetical protein
MNFRTLSTLVVWALLALAAGRASQAGSLTFDGVTIGTLTTQGPFIDQDGFQGGVSIWANWTLDPLQTLVDASNLRWLQVAVYSQDVGSPYPEPMRPFVDPLPYQWLDLYKADNLPWYDISGPTKGALAVTGRGGGPWTGDGPFAPWGYAPLTFLVETFVVAITDEANKQARILGGVAWGYSLDSSWNQNTTAIKATELGNTADTRAYVNAALALDYPGWIVTIPEPSSIVLLLLGAVVFAAIGARNRAHHRH